MQLCEGKAMGQGNKFLSGIFWYIKITQDRRTKLSFPFSTHENYTNTRKKQYRFWFVLGNNSCRCQGFIP